MSKGMTLKQIRLEEFFTALEAYEKALRTGKNIVEASLRIHVAKGGVSRRLGALVNRVSRATVRDKSES